MSHCAAAGGSARRGLGRLHSTNQDEDESSCDETHTVVDVLVVVVVVLLVVVPVLPPELTVVEYAVVVRRAVPLGKE